MLNKYADTYEKDPKSADLEKIESKLADLGKKLLSSELSEADREKLASKYETEMAEAAKRYTEIKTETAFGGMGKMLDELKANGFGK